MDVFAAACAFARGELTRPEALEAVRADLGSLRAAPPDALRAGLDAVLLSEAPSRALDLLCDAGALDVFLPEVPALKMEQCGPARHKDNYVHTLRVLDQAIELERSGPDLVLRLAAVLHDVGKPDTRAYAGREVTFHGHEVVGARIARRRLLALGYERPVVDDVCRLVELHLRTFGYRPGRWADSGIRRYVTDAGPLLSRLNALVRADVTTGRPAQRRRLHEGIDDLEAQIARLEREAAEAALRPALDGGAVMELLGLSPGPLVGRALGHLLALRRSGVELSVEEAEVELRRWAQTQGT